MRAPEVPPSIKVGGQSELDVWADAIVADWPPIGQAQRERLAGLLTPAAEPDDGNEP